MLMFRFWGSDSRGSEQTIVEVQQPMQLDTSLSAATAIEEHPAVSPSSSNASAVVNAPQAHVKRARDDEVTDDAPVPKRPRAEGQAIGSLSPPTSDDVSFTSHLSDSQERACDAIQFHFSLEILYKHDELRMIDQELAKCQIALEQLRRCHLIPYPVTCPTPDQMIEICSGKGPALKEQGKEVPRWAAPFGVVDGPYARHYAKWLIPDPMFDGMLPDWSPPYQSSRARAAPEGRTTRNSIGDTSAKGGRPVRGNAGQKLQALSTAAAAAPPREKAACILERKQDGVMVKLVCLDCHRANFLSIQGFINHCRIAHRREFKSHEDAAIHCGHPIDSADAAAPQPASEAKQAAPPVAHPPAPAPAPAPSAAPPSGLVHPFARSDMAEQAAYVSLQSRIRDSIKLYHQGKLPGITSIPGQEKEASTAAPSSFVPSSDTPYLSALMKSKNFGGDLQQLTSEAKTPLETDYMPSPGEDPEDILDSFDPPVPMSRAPMMRMPAKGGIAPPQHASSAQPTCSKGPGLAYPNESSAMLQDDDVDMESPNTVASHTAPSLVSDDGEYDDSDDGCSVSEAGSDSLEAESISDVTEINIDEDGEAPRLRHQACSGSGTAVRLKKDDGKAVTLVSPVKNANKERRSRNMEKI